VVKKPALEWLFIGVSAADIQPDSDGLTRFHSSSYGIWSHGVVAAAGKKIIRDFGELPVTSLVRTDWFVHRTVYDTLFRAGDEVEVVLDCTAHTLRLQSPTVQHVIPIQQQHHQQKWVLNVNFSLGEHQVSLG